jgi:hypothetical protein
MTCKNCGQTFDSKFCPSCGQTANIHRVTFKHFFHELFHAFTHADKGILLLAKELIKRPGHIAREWLDGKRKRYFNPLSFLVLTTAFYAFVSYHSGYFKTMSAGPRKPTTEQRAQMRERPSPTMLSIYKAMGEAGQISINNGKVLGLFLIYPWMAIFTALLYIRNKANLAEILVLCAFVMGELYILMAVIFIPAFLIAPSTVDLNNLVFHVVSVIYMIVAYQQFFKNHIAITIIKALFVKGLYIVFFWLSIVAYVLVKNAIIA